MFPTHFGQPIFLCGWVVWRLGLLWVSGPAWFRGDGKMQSEGNDTLCTCFQHNFVQECTQINKNVCNEQPLSAEENNCVTPKRINWVTFNPPEAEGEGVSPAGSSPSGCCLQAGVLGDGASHVGKHHLGPLLLECRALRRQRA